MKLADWLHKSNSTPEQLRRKLGVPNRSTIHRWLDGTRRPCMDRLHQIELLTEGKVTKADFDDPAPPVCAQVVQNELGEEDWVFPWSRGYDRHKAAMDSLRQEPQEWETFTTPVAKALDVLGSRAKLTPRGTFLLDGRPTDARRIVKAANDVLTQHGLAPMPYPTLKRREP